MIPSTLILQYFHAAQCHLHDLLSSASSSYAETIDKECSGDNNDSKNNNLLSYHRNQIVHAQHMALDETIDAWQVKQHEEGMVSDNNNCIVVSRESMLSALRQIGSGDYSAIVYVGGMTANSNSSNGASIVSSDEEGMLMSLSLVDKNQQQHQQQHASITTAMEQTNEIARLVYTRMVLSSVATNAATTTSLSSSIISSSRCSDYVKMNENDNSNSKEDDELPMDERTISDYLALAMSAIRLPEVKQYLHHNGGHHDADTSSLLTFLFNTDKKCSQDDKVGLEDTSKQQHSNNEKEQGLQYVQRLCWHAVLGIQSTSEQHEYAMNYLQYILDKEFGTSTGTGEKKKYNYSSKLITTLAEYRSIMSTAMIVNDVTTTTTTATSLNLKESNEKEDSSSSNAVQHQLLPPSNECDDGTTRIVGVSYSEFIIDGDNNSSSNSDNNGVPKSNVIHEHEIIQSRNEFHIRKAACTLQESIINEYYMLSQSQREETLVEATAVYDKLIMNMENVTSEKERVQLLQNMTIDEQRLLVIYKAIVSNNSSSSSTKEANEK
jgi:hypothetical protein